jgi:hypothetical protein
MTTTLVYAYFSVLIATIATIAQPPRFPDFQHQRLCMKIQSYGGSSHITSHPIFHFIQCSSWNITKYVEFPPTPPWNGIEIIWNRE